MTQNILIEILKQRQLTLATLRFSVHPDISQNNCNRYLFQHLEEKVRCEKIEVEGLKAKATEMLASGQQSHAATQAQAILHKFDTLDKNIKVTFVK